MSELFDIPESLPPRLRWMRDNLIDVVDSGIDHEHGNECETTGDQLYRYHAFVRAKATKSESVHGSGHTEADALLDLASKLNLKGWMG